MAKEYGHKSVKYERIDRENAKIVAAVGGAAFIVVFSLFAVRALFSQSLYHGRVISAKESTLETLENNTANATTLNNSYSAFVNEPENVLAGNPSGDGANDGDNAKIVLDALPSEYDYPGLSSSIEKVLVDGGYQIETIGGTEESAVNDDPSAPLDIPYPFTVLAKQTETEKLMKTLEKSIRPISIETIKISSSEIGLTTTFGVKTYYQPGVEYQLGATVVK